MTISEKEKPVTPPPLPPKFQEGGLKRFTDIDVFREYVHEMAPIGYVAVVVFEKDLIDSPGTVLKGMIEQVKALKEL